MIILRTDPLFISPVAAPVLEENLAIIETRVGEAERAINRLERLVTIPGAEGEGVSP
jgi:hypothetical protein